MAESYVNIDKAVQIFGQIVKRKTIYNETNLHFEYFRLAGDTIPFKDLGYESLQQFIKINAADKFYFEKVGNDFEFIAPKRIESPSKQMDFELSSSSGSNNNKLVALKQIFETSEKCEPNGSDSMASNEPMGLTVVKHVAKNLDHDSPPRKNICVSHNIRFSSPSSTGLNNPFQKFRNDIRISVNVNTKTRAVDCQTMDTDAKPMPMNAMDSNIAKNYEESSGFEYSVDSDSLPFVEYPWNDRYWHLKITNPVSTNKVWARFYDEFESDMRKLAVKLVQAVQANSSNPSVCDPHKIYVVKDDNNQYYRCRVSHYETNSDQCKCFLIDVGTTNWYDLINVFHCPFELHQIRPMAIRLQLQGLVEFKDNRNARAIIVRELSQKCVWARIQTKKQEFLGTNSITVILFDRLDRETRINICLEIKEQLIETFSPPKLLQHSTNYVVISHISKATGLIYCHLLYNEEELKYLNVLIETFVADGIQLSFKNVESETELHTNIANNAGKLYLIYSKCDKKWYRATILQLDLNAAQTSKPVSLLEYYAAYCFLVDYGNTRCTPLNNIYELHGMSSKYPFLAIAMELDGVRMNRTKIDLLKRLLQSGSKAMADVVETINNDDPNKMKTISKVRLTWVPSRKEDSDKSDINKLLE